MRPGQGQQGNVPMEEAAALARGDANATCRDYRLLLGYQGEHTDKPIQIVLNFMSNGDVSGRSKYYSPIPGKLGGKNSPGSPQWFSIYRIFENVFSQQIKTYVSFFQ